MRASFWAVSASAVVVLASAWAENRTPLVLHADSLARYEAITAYCEKVDPSSASQYVAKLTALTSGRSSDTLAADRTSPKYLQALAQADTTLSKASRATGINGCTEFLAEK